MNNPDATVEARRRFIALVGGGALLTPFLGLAGCGGKEEAPVQAAPASSSSSSAEPQTTATRPESPQASANGAIPRLSEDDPQARSLAYVHNADDVIASEQARYEQGQACSNCQLYQGTANDEWAGCPLFAGKLAKGTGWCTAYASRSG
ncbi:MAG: high-potential iron-sulfur protein [Haliea sp.]